MFNCDMCDFATESRERYAGHRSGHARRKENLIKAIKRHICAKCDLEFDSGRALGSHLSHHRSLERPFHELKTSGARKTRLIHDRGYQCEICKNVEWQGKSIPLQLDHINGDSDDNDLTNLRLLCPNCHAQTPTYCGKNMGKKATKSRRGINMQRHYDKLKLS